MKQHSTDDLGTLLREWKVEAELPPRFGDQVWRAIDRRQRVKATPRAVRWMNWVEAAFRKPGWATVYVTALFVIGLSTGYYKQAALNASLDENAKGQYLKLVSPYHAQNARPL